MRLFKRSGPASISWALASVIALGVLGGCQEKKVDAEPVVRPVRAIKVADSSNFNRRTFSGRARGTQEVDLAFRISGPLIQRQADVGTEVKKGTILAQIDPATFKADVDRAKANVLKADAASKNAQEQLKRKKFLVKKGHESVATLDRYLAAERESRATLTAQKATLKRKQLDLKYTTLRAPFSGIVVKTYVDNFQGVREKQPIVRLVDNSRIEMVVDLPENLISQVHTVKKVDVVFDAFPDNQVAATIKEVGTEASETTRTYPVTLIMDQPSGAKILPGMAGKASKAADANGTLQVTKIIVPETAILTKDDPSKTYVWVIDDGAKTVSTREVKTGALDSLGVVLNDGLKPGEWIVTAGVNYLRDGQKVRILEQ